MEFFSRLWEQVTEVAVGLARTPFDLSVRFALLYLGVSILIAILLWHLRGRPSGLIRWLVPRETYRHRSNLLDIKLFLTNRIIGLSGILGALVITPLVSFFVLGALSRGAPVITPGELTFLAALWSTMVIVLATDFCRYWAHRLHHEIDVLWPFHAVHHSAEVLTPLTLARSHPVEAMFRMLIIGVIVGIVQGATLYALGAPLDPLTIGGGNAIYFLFNALGSNLRHSHIWLSYGRVLEHILISPAQHQIHHSSAPEHHNKNYGSIFALWDWAFGTLYVPRAQEDLTFGIADENGVRIAQPHPTLRAALVGPFVDSFNAMRARMGKAEPPALEREQG